MASMADVANVPDVGTVMQSLPMAVLLIHPDRTVIAANPATESLLGQSEHRLVGRVVNDLFEFDDERIIPGLADHDADFAARRVMMQPPEGPARRVDVSVCPVSQHPGWHLVVLVDSGALSTIFDDSSGGEGFTVRGPDILAHEIKNPLAAIKGAAQLIGRNTRDGNLPMVELITGEVERIAGLIDEMQTLTRRAAQPSEPCNIYEPLARARAILEAAHPDAPQIEESFDPSIPPVLATHESLVQIVLNLLTNAHEATAGVEKPQIWITTRFVSGISLRLSDSQRLIRLPVQLKISDNGPGIPATLVEDIFSPFVSSKKNSQGLGLALVQKLVRDMNGRIAYDRDSEKGLTNFRVFLPIAPSERPEA